MRDDKASPVICHKCEYRPPPKADNPGLCPNDAFVLVEVSEHQKAPRDKHLGRTVGERYQVVGILGTGGMSTVYRARQLPMGREVALKLIQPGAAGYAEFEDRVRREAEAIAALDHPSIVTLFDYGVEPDGNQFMVLELVRGETLQNLRVTGKITRTAFLRLIDNVLDALEAAHRCGLVHRDLKPGNIMIAKTGSDRDVVKILDFGIAKVVQGPMVAGDSLTETGAAYGTPHYMAPEQFRDARSVDQRADLYSVGVMLYEGLTGSVPFNGGSAVEIYMKHMTAPVPEMGPTIPAPLSAVVTKALTKDPVLRFQTAAEMREALVVAMAEVDGESAGPMLVGRATFSNTGESLPYAQQGPNVSLVSSALAGNLVEVSELLSRAHQAAPKAGALAAAMGGVVILLAVVALVML